MASFKDSFASARKAGKKNFTWNGKSYNTKLADGGPSVKLPKTAPIPTEKPKFDKNAGPSKDRFGSGLGAKTDAGKKLADAFTQPKTTKKTSRPEKTKYEKSYNPFTNQVKDKISYNPFTNKASKVKAK